MERYRERTATRLPTLASIRGHTRMNVFEIACKLIDVESITPNEERIGVCRDFAHLAVTFCRCMNIPARYCTGYLGDIEVPRDPAPMDFSAWFEVFLDGRWYTFDARHNHPRIGRIVIARGRDAADVAISTTFGSAALARFTVVTDEVADKASRARTLETVV